MKKFLVGLVAVLLLSCLTFGQTTPPAWFTPTIRASIADADSTGDATQLRVTQIEAKVDSIRLENPGPVSTTAKAFLTGAGPSSDTLFLYTGAYELVAFQGVVTTVQSAVAIKFVVRVKVGATTTLLADSSASISGDAVGTMYHVWTDSLAGAVQKATALTAYVPEVSADLTHQPRYRIRLPSTGANTGAIYITTLGADANTGVAKWSIVARPLEEGSTLAKK